MEALWRKLKTTSQLALTELGKAQKAQQKCYDSQVSPREFIAGQKVLLLPSSANKLLVHWRGPFEVVEKVGDVDFRIRIPGQGTKLYHVNLLKAWQETVEPGWYQAELDWNKDGRKWSQEIQRQVTTGFPASEWQLRQVQQLLGEYPRVIQDVLGGMESVTHDIPTRPGKVVRVPYNQPLSP